jgi:hypothetical protein
VVCPLITNVDERGHYRIEQGRETVQTPSKHGIIAMQYAMPLKKSCSRCFLIQKLCEQLSMHATHPLLEQNIRQT